MKVLLGEEFFSEESLTDDPFLVPSLFKACRDFGHALILDFGSDVSVSYRAWRDCRPTYEREMIEQSIKASLERATRTHTIEIRATTGQSDWTADPTRIGPADLWDVLSAPLTILVEHEVNDAAFLKAVPFGFEAKTFRDLVASGRVRFDNGGGSAMKAVIVDRGRVPARAHRMWAVFDSDALVPGKPSKESEGKVNACKAARIRWHRLERRAIENYLPPIEVAEAKKTKPLEFQQAAGSFKRLHAAQRAHFNLKEGFDGDRAHLEAGGTDATLRSDVEALFAGAPVAKLAKGFGRDIAERFVPDPDRGRPGISDHVRRIDGQEAEMVPLFRSILRSL